MLTRIKTLVNLNNYYKFLSSDPLTFNGIYLSCVDTGASLCGDEDIWSAYEMPLSRERLAQLVHDAEIDVQNALGTPVGLTWIREEIEIPKVWFNNKRSINITDMTFRTKFSNVKRFGQAKLQKILPSEQVVLSDDDNDGFTETGTLIFTLPEGYDYCDIKLYFKDTNYELQGFEITKYDSEIREVTIHIDGWLLVNPELYIKRGFNRNIPAIDGCQIDNFIDLLDIYIDTVDSCKPMVEFVSSDTTRCSNSCEQTKQPGCATVIDGCNGTFSVNFQTYDEDGCVIAGNPCSCCTPDKIIVYYQAGCDITCNDCSDIEDIVFKLATSRYPKPTCDCKCFTSVMLDLAQQTSFIVKNEGFLVRYNQVYMENAIFGSRVGEIEASIALQRIKEKYCNYE